MDITPKDQVETKAVNIGQRIATAIGIVVAMGSTLLVAVGGLDWIVANLPLLGTGVGMLATGGLTAYVAVRRMRVDRAASKAGLLLVLLLPALLSGCAAVYTPKLSAISWGINSSQVLSGLNVSRNSSATNDSYEIILDSSTGQQSSAKLIDGIIAIGEIAARAKGIPVDSASGVASRASVVESAPAAEEQTETVEDADAPDVVYSSEGYGASPAADGSGVYGSPTCSRCRSYRAAHPGVTLIDINDAAHRAALWSALRARGYTGSSVPLPVVVSSSTYTLSAK